MKVAYVCTDPGVPVFGNKGGSIHVQSVVRSFLARGADVSLFARRVGGQPPAGLESVRVRQLSKAPKGQTPERERFLLGVNDELRALLEAEGEFDLVYERHALFSHAAMEYARDADVPGLLEINAPLVEEQQRFRALSLVGEAESSRRRCFDAADAMLAVSRPLADWVATRADPRRVYVVPNGVDISRFGPAVPQALPAPQGIVTIGFVGSLRPWHGVETLAEAFGLLRRDGAPVRLVIVGDGPMRETIENSCSAHADATVFTGAVHPDEVPGLLASMDIAVAPYPPLDGFYFSPLKLFEYMAAAVAIAASASGQIGEVIEHGRNGLLFEPGHVEALRETLSRLIGDRELRGRLAEAARRDAADRHGWDRVVERVLRIAASSGEVPA